jgi:SSS family transporter
LCFINKSLLAAAETSPIQFDWKVLSQIPPASGQNEQPGLAGAFMGVDNGALIIAGGANFPDGPAWEGGSKVYHSAIYILEKEGEEYNWLDKKSFSLKHKIAYGLSIPSSKGLICIGGMNQSQFFKEVFVLKWQKEKEELVQEDLPPLPAPVANLNGGKIGNYIYVAATNTANNQGHFWRLDLNGFEKGWETLPLWDGKIRTHAFGVVQNNGEQDCFYLFKGRYATKNGVSELYADGFCYNPISNQWTSIEIEKEANSQEAVFLSAGTALPVGANHILLFGGAEGQLLNKLEQYALDIAAAKDTLLKSKLTQDRDAILINHPGFSRDIYAFHTIGQTLTKVGTLPQGSSVTTTALEWDNQFFIPTGEIAPCIRTPNILVGTTHSETNFGTLNYVVLAVYLLLLVGMGLVLARNQHSTEDFFKAGNRIPWWAAGISIFGTQLSAITFMAIPAKTYATDWLYFFLMMTIIMVMPFIIRYFLPFYRRFNLTTAYEYLELRFNLIARLIGSSMYIFLQLGRLGIVLLLPSLALSVVTGLDVYFCILSMGILSILYTVLGGIEAVIWTDVIQVFVLLGGALLSLVLIYLDLDKAMLTQHIQDFGKMRIFDFTLSFASPTLWVVLLGGFASNLIQYGSDQTVIQRYLTTKDEASAAKSIRIGAWMALPSTFIFFTLGTLLFVFYKENPIALNPLLEKTDTIFPWYIIQNLPDGISGLLIAAIFAASMSSLDSSMNSVATVITTDFVRRLNPLTNEANYLRLARVITIIIGIMGTGLALLMATWGIASLWDQFNMIIGLFAGGLGGIFLLGIFSSKASGKGAIIGLIISGIAQYFIKEYTSVNLLLYAFTGMIISVIIGYLASLVLGEKSSASKQAYTYYALKK